MPEGYSGINSRLHGIYIDPRHGVNPRFRWAKAPTKDELTKLTHTIAHRVGRYLEREGLLERDTGTCYLTPEAIIASDEDPSNNLPGSSITYRIAVGPQRGHTVFTLRGLLALRAGAALSRLVSFVPRMSDSTSNGVVLLKEHVGKNYLLTDTKKGTAGFLSPRV